jgi:carbon-monoxide dehydrogenase large subunit
MIGQRLRRFEDERLLTGRGSFTDDINLPGQVAAVFVRSPHAHADIASIDTGAARALPGVLGVWHGRDLTLAGGAAIPSGIPAGRMAEYPNRDGSLMAEPPSFVLAQDRVRHVGEAVAVVVAENAAAAEAAAEAVIVDYRPHPSVAAAAAAMAASAPLLWPDIPCNLCFDYGAGDAAATDAALAAADLVVSLEIVNNRIVVNFLEPRAAVARFDPAEGRFLLHVGCQSVHGLRTQLARALGVAPGQLRVVSTDVGGAFGARSVLYPEYVAVLWLARALGRPVKWTAHRSEEFCATTQGRDSVLRGELGLDRDRRFVGLRVTGVANLGARHAGNGPFSIIRNLERMLPAVYDIPALSLSLKGVFTNTVPVSSYRGVGRMEANYLIERLIDKAARRIGTDRVALRQRNLIPAAAMPHRTVAGSIYDSGDYAKNMAMAMAAADWQGFAARRAESERRGRLRGIGIVNYIEGAGGVAGEYASVVIDGDGSVAVGAGSVAQGQGHRTTFRQIVATELGVAADRIAVMASDTDLVRDGVGSNASRSMVRAGPALVDAARAAIAGGRATAARLLQVAADAVRFSDGRYRVAGTDRSVDLFEVARAAADDAGRRSVLTGESRNDSDALTYPNGCHICEVEIDPETGSVAVLAFVAVDDVGRAINPMIVRGQSQGGIVQGIGQALLERGAYDPVSGQLLTGSFLDYAMPRAAHIPSVRPIPNDTPSPANPLGVKGAGEGGATGAPAAVINAVLDALAPLGVDEIDMPATPDRIWSAIQSARRRRMLVASPGIVL